MFKQFFLLNALTLFFFVGCSIGTSTTNTGNTNATVNTAIVAPTNDNANNTISNENINDDMSDVDTNDWNTFVFDDLKFSMKLPFDQEAIETHYTECDQSTACDKFGYRYSASFKKNNALTTFLSSVSENWSPSRDSDLTDFHTYKIIDNQYFLNNSTVNPIHLIQSLVIEHGIDVIVFDACKDYYSIDRYENGNTFSCTQAQNTAIFKLYDNNKFDAVLVTFHDNDLSLEEFSKALSTIHFF